MLPVVLGFRLQSLAFVIHWVLLAGYVPETLQACSVRIAQNCGISLMLNMSMLELPACADLDSST